MLVVMGPGGRAVVAGQDDERTLAQPQRVDLGHEPADLLVHLLEDRMNFLERINAVLRYQQADTIPFAPYDNLIPRGDFAREMRNRGQEE